MSSPTLGSNDSISVQASREDRAGCGPELCSDSGVPVTGAARNAAAGTAQRIPIQRAVPHSIAGLEKSSARSFVGLQPDLLK